MSIVRWEPGAELADLRRSVRRLFDESRLDPSGPRAFPVDVYETPAELIVRADLPGLAREDVKVHMQGGNLAIRAARRPSVPEGARALQQETLTGEFSRAFSLGTAVLADAVTAKYDGGVLTVHLPKADEARGRTITVEAS